MNFNFVSSTSWGSIPNYLEAIGFGRADQEKLAASMLAYAED